MKFLLSIFISYLIGSIPTAYIITKLFKSVDIRTYGSGNPGATNVLRVVGKTAAIITLAIDFLKGFLTVKISQILGSGPEFQILYGTVAVAGHNWPIWLKFRGGKGVATAFGVVSVLMPGIALLSFAVFIIAVLSTGYVSVGSMLAASAFSIFAWLNISEISLTAKIIVSILTIIIIFRHKDNIKRLLNGKEPKIQL